MSTRVVLGIAAVTVVAVIGGIVVSPWLVAVLDRVTTAPAPLPDQRTWYTLDDDTDPGFVVGARRWTMSPTWRVAEQPAGHAALETPQGTFVLGPITKCYKASPGRHSYEFAADSGDVVTFTRRWSRIPWPRPFEINWLGGSTAKWGRYVYHRLEWRKRDGAVLVATWRDEQRLWNGEWVDQYLPREPTVSVRMAR